MINIVDKQTESWKVWLLKLEVFFMWNYTVFSIEEDRLLGLHCILPSHKSLGAESVSWAHPVGQVP